MGISNSDNITNKTIVTITGKAQANSTVELFNVLNSLGTTTADDSGNFSKKVTLAENTTLVKVGFVVSTLTDKTLEAELVLPSASVALAVMCVVTYKITPNVVPATPDNIVITATNIAGNTETHNVVITMVIKLAVTITSNKLNGANGAFKLTFTFTEQVSGFELGDILSNFWVNGMAAILTRFEVALATTSAAISTVMLPSVSVVFGVTIKVKTLL
jgi:hypothetical protein